MKIAINIAFIYDDKMIDGVGQYSLNLLEGLRDIGRLNDHFIIIANNGFYSTACDMFPEASIVCVNIPRVLKYITNRLKRKIFWQMLYIDRYIIPRIIRRKKVDALFHTFNNINIYINKDITTVTTFHDMFYKNFPKEYSKKKMKYILYRYRGILYDSKYLITPSNYVKNDILKFYPDINNDKITAIYVPIRINEASFEKYDVDKPYILSVNSIRNHKNLITLIKAFKHIQDKTDHSLVLVGYIDPRARDIIDYVKDNNIKNVIFTGNIPNSQRDYLYKNADLFVSPSLHEGFGMTPVEAALYEIPVLTTNKTSIPEVTKGLVNYYEPATDDVVLAEKMLELLSARHDKNRLKHIKNVFAEEYDYKKIAMQYFDFLLKCTKFNPKSET